MKKIIITLLFFCGLTAIAQTEKYYSSFPLRNGKIEAIIQEGENNGTKLLGFSAADKSGAMAYQFNEKASSASKKDVYSTFGIYMIKYDNDSYVSVYPDEPISLGNGQWVNFKYSNFYSKDAAKAKGMTKEKIEDWARKFSEEVMNN